MPIHIAVLAPAAGIVKVGCAPAQNMNTAFMLNRHRLGLIDGHLGQSGPAPGSVEHVHLPARLPVTFRGAMEIGRASCRERVENSVRNGLRKKKKNRVK